MSDGVEPTLLFDALLGRLSDDPRSGSGCSAARSRRRPAPTGGGGRRRRRAGTACSSSPACCRRPSSAGELSACDAVAFLDRGGPSSRKGTLAAALAHGRPVVAVDGPERWPLLVEAGAIRLVPAEPTELADVLDDLRRSPETRARLGAAAAAFHAEHQAVERAADRLAHLLAGPATSDEARRPLIDAVR